MKFSDSASGLLAIAIGGAVAAYSSAFPQMPGQPIGPAAFPAIIGVALIAAGATLVANGMRRRSVAWIELPEWVRRPRMLWNFILVLVALLFYAFVVDRLGFFITAILFLSMLFAAFGVPRRKVLPIAIVVTLAIHYSFYTLLRVPLPWGVLEGIAW
jgi:putative tricarboxylic transport membrane protein